MKEIILDSNDTYSIVLTKTNIDAVNIMQKYNSNDFKNEQYIFDFPCKLNDVLAIGLSYDVNETLLKNFIPSKHNQELNYKCYSKKDFSNDICILHESATSAYYCALELLGKPKYVVIYKRENVTN